MGIERQIEIIKTLQKGAASGESISKKFGISRTALWKDIKLLRDTGFEISGKASAGYSLIKQPAILNEIAFSLTRKTKNLGKKFILLKTASSTHDIAKKIASETKDGKTLIAALSQSQGKGRLGREWYSPEGGLWLSLILRPRIPIKDLPKIGLLCALAAVDTFKNFSVKASIKWPNDIIVNGKKIAGILLEASGEPDRIDYLIVSIGINLNMEIKALPDEVTQTSTTLKEILGKEVSSNHFLADFLLNFEILLDDLDNGWRKMTRLWPELDVLSGKKITAKSGIREITGVSRGINDDGHLVLATNQGDVSLVSGEITTKLKVED
jgi:BirA family biotin operon repressor/biotin-[acetyl-CoA-carboxylase] ligase